MKTKLSIITACALLCTAIAGWLFILKIQDQAKQQHELDIRSQLEYRQSLVDQIQGTSTTVNGIQQGIRAGLINETNGLRMMGQVHAGIIELQAQIAEFDRTNTTGIH